MAPNKKGKNRLANLLHHFLFILLHVLALLIISPFDKSRKSRIVRVLLVKFGPHKLFDRKIITVKLNRHYGWLASLLFLRLIKSRWLFGIPKSKLEHCVIFWDIIAILQEPRWSVAWTVIQFNIWLTVRSVLSRWWLVLWSGSWHIFLIRICLRMTYRALLLLVFLLGPLFAVFWIILLVIEHHLINDIKLILSHTLLLLCVSCCMTKLCRLFELFWGPWNLFFLLDSNELSNQILIGGASNLRCCLGLSQKLCLPLYFFLFFLHIWNPENFQNYVKIT